MNAKDKLELARETLQGLDKVLLSILSLRFQEALIIERNKRDLPDPTIDHPEIEAARLAELLAKLPPRLDPEFVQNLFQLIFKESKRLQMAQRENEAPNSS